MELRHINILLFFLKEELKDASNNEEWERVQKQINMLLFKEALIKRVKDESSILRLGH